MVLWAPVITTAAAAQHYSKAVRNFASQAEGSLPATSSLKHPKPIIMKETTMKISALAALIAVLSIIAASAVQAASASGAGGDLRGGQSQGQNGSGATTQGGNGGANGGDVHK
jgi:hypothetical protein